MASLICSTEMHAPLTGGCLCGTVRYTIKFPPGATYPPKRMTCQCTQCRKCFGALIGHFLGVSTSQISWKPAGAATPIDPYDPADPAACHIAGSSPSTAAPGYKEFRSSPPCLRGFCSACGSSLTWRDTGSPESIDVLVGTLDEQVLARYPELVSEAEEHLYCGNSVKGVTDCGLKGGVKYKDMQKGEKWTSME